MDGGFKRFYFTFFYFLGMCKL